MARGRSPALPILIGAAATMVTLAGLRAAALTLRHHLRPLGRTTLGASSGLYGNGMAFSRELLEHRAWTNHLTEDIEMQMELLLEGTLVVYAPAAVIEAEMPATP